MKRTLAVTGAALAVVGSTLLTAPPAAAADQCVGGSSSGRCVSVVSTSVDTVVVEAAPLENNSDKSVTLNCNFSQTISRSVTDSASAEMSVSAQIAAVGASASVSVTSSLSQTASSASSVGGSVVLAPGESVTCQRTYGSVTSQLREYTYTGTTSTETARYSVEVPSSLGVRIV